MTKTGTLLAAAAAAAFALGTSGSAMAEHHEGGAEKTHCEGANNCKGHGECKSAGNECSGKNECKGKGWVSLSAEECEAAKKSEES